MRAIILSSFLLLFMGITAVSQPMPASSLWRIVIDGQEHPAGGSISKEQLQKLYTWQIKDAAKGTIAKPESFSWVISSKGQIFKGDSRTGLALFTTKAEKLSHGDIVFLDHIVCNQRKLGQMVFTVE